MVIVFFFFKKDMIRVNYTLIFKIILSIIKNYFETK
jgi:hypothetical protein